MKLIISFLLLFTVSALSGAQTMWDMERLKEAPEYYNADGFDEPGVRAVYFNGPDYDGHPTKVFAYIGIPDNVVGLAPGIVLVHGGGGTAWAQWVRLWNSKGYAAISLDTTGSVPDGQFPARKKHERGGPDGWGGFEQIDDDIKRQWPYHAVTNIILAHSLLGSFKEVDGDNIGITGISWGGWLTCIAASVDARFEFAIPVYGCGYLQQDSAWTRTVFAKMGKEKADKWTSLWDPSVYLRACDVPVMWITGTNDTCFPLSSLARSYSLVYELTLCVKPGLSHSHEAGYNIEEAFAFADTVCKDNDFMVMLTRQGVTGNTAWTEYGPEKTPESATFVYTADSGQLKDRRWQEIPAQIDGAASTISADIPEGTTLYFFNAKDNRGLITSSRHRSPPRSVL